MEQYDALIQTLSVAMGAAWASGINLYATILVVGLLGSTGHMALPEALAILTDPLVLGAAGLMYCVEFFADKVPGVDSSWDVLHTFIRIPAGAALAAGSLGDMNSAVMIAAGLVGGGLATTSHLTKTGSRMMINTSPEPLTNWTASLTEDIAVIGGLWVALNHPTLFIGLLILFLIFAAWALPKLYRFIIKMFKKIASWFGKKDQTPSIPPSLEKKID